MFKNKFNFLLTTIFFGWCFLQPAQTFGQTAASCSTVPVGLISIYSGDGNASDARSRNNGTIQNNVTYAAGKIGQAFQLGGNGDLSGNGDRVLIGNPANLQLQDFTIETWIKRSSSAIVTNSPFAGTPNGTFFAYGQNGYGFIIDQNTNRLGLTNVGNSVINSTATITDTNWHHIAVTKSGNQVIFYVDGVADAPAAYNTTFGFTTNAAIGARGDSNVQNAFFGAIDELSIYNRPLPASDIAAIFNSGTSGKCKPAATVPLENLIAWWAGDGDARDLQNTNHGALQNGTGFAVGKVGQSFSFDGVDDFIQISNSNPSLEPDSITIEGWIKPQTSTSPLGGFIYAAREAFVNESFSVYVDNAGKLSIVLSTTASPSASVFETAANSIQFGAFQHFAAGYDAASGTLTAFINGFPAALTNIAGPATLSGPLRKNVSHVIGRRQGAGTPEGPNGTAQYQGIIDELSLYNRALTASEVQSIAGAGTAGKLKINSIVPSGVVAWYPGDGNANDIQGGNNGSLQGSASFAAGKVGQAFSVGGTGNYVSAPDNPAIDFNQTQPMSVEIWAKLNANVGAYDIIAKNDCATQINYQIGYNVFTGHGLYFGGASVNGSAFTGTNLPLNAWTHLAGTFDGTTLRLYVNGVLAAQNTGTLGTPNNGPLTIGSSGNCGGSFPGLLDEATIYNRTLTANEVRGIFEAGSGGKDKSQQNPAATNKTRVGDAEVKFANLTESGAVQETPLDPAKLPPLPSGATLTGLVYDIATSAIFTGNARVCFNLPISAAPFNSATTFNNLKVLHLESGAWVDRTESRDFASRTLCAQTPSLSPFAIVQSSAPTAAGVMIGGRVSIGTRGLSNARLTLTDSNGQTRQVLSNSLGYYRFSDVRAGETYVLSIFSKRYAFDNPAQIINVTEDNLDLNFIASEFK